MINNITTPLSQFLDGLAELHINKLKELHNLKYTTVKEKEELEKEVKGFLVDFIDELESYDKMIEDIEKVLGPEEKKAFRVLKNFKSIRKNFSVLLRKYKVEPITANSGEVVLGLHRVVDTLMNNDYQDGSIIEVKRVGYFWKKDVLKPAEVVVAKND
jgi:molecular chaperone GrpE (heat shock protein)